MTVSPIRPFLLLSTRPEDDIAEQERQSFLRLMGLEPSQLRQLRVNLDSGMDDVATVRLDDYSGLVIGGSPFNSTEPHKTQHQLDVEAALRNVVEKAIEIDFPTFGACYGVGIIGTAAGGVVCRTYGEKASCIEVTITEEGRAEPVLGGIPTTFSCLVGHKEACSSLPDDAVLLVTGEACPIQMFRVHHNIFVTQFHPELEFETFKARLYAYQQSGYFEPGTINSILATCEGKDLSVAAKTLWNFANIYAR